MQVSIIALLIASFVLCTLANTSYDDDNDMMSNNERFARDLEYRKKFAFAFAKRSSNDDSLADRRSHYGADSRFAFAKRRAPKDTADFARFARASSFA